jgi:hypothetical protein
MSQDTASCSLSRPGTTQPHSQILVCDSAYSVTATNERRSILYLLRRIAVSI